MADSVGILVDDVAVLARDSAISTYGGGAWASRGTAIGGEAALKAGAMLKRNILALAGAITQTPVDALDIADANVVNAQTGRTVISLAEVGRIGYFRQDTLPPDFDVQLSVTASHVANGKLYYAANGVQASYVEVDCETGFREAAVDHFARMCPSSSLAHARVPRSAWVTRQTGFRSNLWRHSVQQPSRPSPGHRGH